MQPTDQPTEVNQQPTTNNWLDNEIKEIENNKTSDFPQLPSLKFAENEIIEFDVDFSNPFKRFNGTDMKGKPVVKAIIPVKHNNEQKVLWLNLLNPIYKDLIRLGREGKTHFKVLQTGKQEKTKYVLVR